MIKIIKFLKEKIFPYYKIIKMNNKIIIVDKNGNENMVNKYQRKKVKGLKITINGYNNTIILKEPFNFIDSKFEILGCDAKIEVGSSSWNYRNFHILFSAYASGREVIIGDECSFFGPCRFTLSGEKTKIIVGNECMFSHDVNVYNNDNHTVYDINTGRILNFAKEVVIGHHCWIGHKASVLKNVHLADNIIVGAGAIVTKDFKENYIAIGGNPAKKIKENVAYDLYNQEDYMKRNGIEEKEYKNG